MTSRVGFAGELPAAAVELGDAQPAAADVREPLRERIGARIEDRTVDGQLAGRGAEQPGHEQPAGECERGHRRGPVGGERRDAAGAFAHALAAGAFLGRQIVVDGRRTAAERQQRDRIGDQPLGRRREIDCVHRQFTGSSPARLRRNTARRPSGDTVTLRGSPEREPLGACVLAREGVAHRS